MDIYVDESIHDRAGFIVLAAVCAPPEQVLAAADAMLECGFVPGRDEFKSSIRMEGNRPAQELREHFRSVIRGCKVALAVCKISERHQLANLTAALCHEIAAQTCAAVGHVYLDEGIRQQEINLPPGFHLHYGCKSEAVIGIQLADCCAHSIATMLLNELGIANKRVPASQFYPDDEGDIELAWTLWASIRHALAGRDPIGVADDMGYYEPLYRPFGLVVCDSCDAKLADAVKRRFGSVWIGCIH